MGERSERLKGRGLLELSPRLLDRRRPGREEWEVKRGRGAKGTGEGTAAVTGEKTRVGRRWKETPISVGTTFRKGFETNFGIGSRLWHQVKACRHPIDPDQTCFVSYLAARGEGFASFEETKAHLFARVLCEPYLLRPSW
jgi:hypothetical protein